MNKTGIGIGSASLVLIFVVLCLTIFALITLSSAQAEKAMTEVEERVVRGYYEADILAECILAEIIESDSALEEVRGIPVTAEWDWDLLGETVEFSCPIEGHEQRELYVRAVVFEDSCDILEWRMRDVGEWEIDDSLSVWPGDEDMLLWPGGEDMALFPG